MTDEKGAHVNLSPLSEPAPPPAYFTEQHEDSRSPPDAVHSSSSTLDHSSHYQASMPPSSSSPSLPSGQSAPYPSTLQPQFIPSPYSHLPPHHVTPSNPHHDMTGAVALPGPLYPDSIYQTQNEARHPFSSRYMQHATVEPSLPRVVHCNDSIPHSSLSDASSKTLFMVSDSPTDLPSTLLTHPPMSPKKTDFPHMLNTSDSKPRLNDRWAAIVFICQALLVLALFIRLAAFQFLSFEMISLIVTFVGSFMFSVAYLAICSFCPKLFIVSAFLCTAAVLFAVGIWIIVEGLPGLGIPIIVFGVIDLLVFCRVRSRIPFSACLLKYSLSILRKYPSLFWVTLCGVLINLLWFFFFFCAILSVFWFGDPFATVSSFIIGISVFWTSHVICDVMHVTISGLFATFYFVEGSGQKVKNPVMASFKRAMTYSFGSICFGSLLLSILDTVRSFVELFCCFGCCCICYLPCVRTMTRDHGCFIIDKLARLFNHYAFAQVAIYGKPYIRASKDTWTLLKRSGMNLVINDSIVTTVLNFACICSCVFGGLMGVILEPRYSVGCFFICGWVGFSVTSLFTQVVYSGVATVFVCFSEDPLAIQRTQPKLYEELKRHLDQALSKRKQLEESTEMSTEQPPKI